MTVGEGDLAVVVHLPPEGQVWNHDKKTLEPCELIVRSMIKSEQYWERPLPPADYAKKLKKEKEIQRTDGSYNDPDLQKYRAREWHRRLYGCWFMNNGKMIYLTGFHYYYLTHWKIDIGPPEFRYSDLKKAYFVKYCEGDPLCYGVLEVTKRRAGKTYFSGCWLTEFSSRSPNAWSGIQSKTGDDAKSVFGKAVVQPFRKLIDFFKPEYDRTGGDVPKKELRFFKTSKKGFKGNDEYDTSTELESKVDFRNSKAEAYDGEKLMRYLCDEIFKTTDVDILERHRKHMPCLEDSSGNVIGKALYTSTVEEMEGQLDDYIQLWADSDQSKKKTSGKTKSGLYRFFTPAQDMIFIDKYGMPDSKKGLEKLMAERVDLMDDPRGLASFIRKNPTNWKEAFRTDGEQCLYNAMKIDERLDTLNWKKDSYEKYDLIWTDETKTKVKLVKSAKGKFKFSWTFEDNGNPEEANNVQVRGTNVSPKNILRFVIGIDPYDHNRTKNGRFSNGAGAVYMKFNPLSQDDSDNFVCTYVARPQTAQLFYEDMIKLCHYFGCQMLFEDQKQGIKNYFHDRGYAAFIMKDDKGNEGISASQKTHQTIVEHTELFIEDNCHRVNHDDLLNDWKAFDMEDTEKFDLGMASGYALIGAKRIKNREVRIKRRSGHSLNRFQKTYKLYNREKQLSKPLR